MAADWGVLMLEHVCVCSLVVKVAREEICCSLVDLCHRHSVGWKTGTASRLWLFRQARDVRKHRCVSIHSTPCKPQPMGQHKRSSCCSAELIS